jgi:hypothetical protein
MTRLVFDLPGEAGSRSAGVYAGHTQEHPVLDKLLEQPSQMIDASYCNQEANPSSRSTLNCFSLNWVRRLEVQELVETLPGHAANGLGPSIGSILSTVHAGLAPGLHSPLEDELPSDHLGLRHAYPDIPKST